MKIHEYSAKNLLRQFSIPTPRGALATSPGEARQVALLLGGRVVVKAQVYAGGRGKAGGIKIAATPEEAEKAAFSLIGSRLVTSQTPTGNGVPVSKVLVEELLPIERELYLGILVDSSRRVPVILASESGGIDIEESQPSREKVSKIFIDPVTGFQPHHGRILARRLELEQPFVAPITDLASNLFRLFQAKDCSLVEINPLAVTPDRKLVALDAKINFDDNALFRHPDIASLRDMEQEDPLEAKAVSLGIRNYVKLDGNIGCMVNGAGLAMAVLDLVRQLGGRPANFLDIGTANNTERVVNAFHLFRSDPNVEVILIYIFGGLARVDIIARGIVEAFGQMDITTPVVVHLAGNNVEEGERVLKESGINLLRAHSMQEATEKAVKAIGKIAQSSEIRKPSAPVSPSGGEAV